MRAATCNEREFPKLVNYNFSLPECEQDVHKSVRELLYRFSGQQRVQLMPHTAWTDCKIWQTSLTGPKRISSQFYNFRPLLTMLYISQHFRSLHLPCTPHPSFELLCQRLAAAVGCLAGGDSDVGVLL